MPQDIPTTCNGCGNRFTIDHALSCPKGGLVLARYDDAEKEWGALVSRALISSAITYEPKINSRTVQRERTGLGAWQDGGAANGRAEILGESLGEGVVDGQ